MERKIIFETVAGSKLYGTNHEKSDDDFLGIFIPTVDEVLGVHNYSSEMSRNEKNTDGLRNSKGDVDRKYFSLKQFLLLASEGQSKQIEMLFSPSNKWVSSSPEWEEILNHRHLFLSRQSIKPFLQFAVAQSFDSVTKGQNLDMLEKLVKFFEGKAGRLRDHIHQEEFKNLKLDIIELNPKMSTQKKVEAFEVAGRKYELHLKVHDFIPAASSVISTYGKRSQNSKNNGIDLKSLAHAYRLLLETETLLKEQKLILPLPEEQIVFLKSILNNQYHPEIGYEVDLDLRIKEIKKIESQLPDKVDMGKINKLCIKIMKMSLKL